MANWGDIEPLLSQGIAEFLEDKLPEMGGVRWWENHVLGQLTPSQSMVATHLDIGNLRGLDLASLLRVSMRNWSELAFRFHLDKDDQETVRQLMDARNRHAHRPVDGLKRAIVQADMDLALRYLKTIEADPELLVRCGKFCNAFEKATLLKANTHATVPASNHDGELVGLSVHAAQNGVKAEVSNGGWLVNSKPHATELEAILTNSTYVGIDFGTSTTVVSFVHMSRQHLLMADTLKLAQPNQMGGTTRHHLVNSALAFTNSERILFGLDAHRLRPHLVDGQSVFTSFKMQLGVEIGPTYPASKLRRGSGSIAIESARDATTEFFRFLHSAISEAIAARELHPQLKFAVSVPASFEANQRRALLECTKNAGLGIDASCLIDEPNAAFLSFMNACIHQEQDQELALAMKKNGLNMLVYDFGAGTCDVSILHVALPGGKLQSKNLAISKFAALGGDDIDRAIAEKVLMPQLRKANPNFDLTDTHVSKRVVPKLMPTAERLKIAANEWLTERCVERLETIASLEETFSDHSFSYKIVRKGEKGSEVQETFVLNTPSLSMADLAEVLMPFMGRFDDFHPGQHVFSPVDDALAKSGLMPYDLTAVLFIGGSAKSSLVQECVMRHLPDKVRSIVPSDLQSHVSTGAAIHSLGFHGFGFNFVSPITSEPILMITRNGGMETIVPASAAVPSEKPFKLSLTIDRDAQSTIELPICVSSESKLLGLLRLSAPDGRSFDRGSIVEVKASITEDKLLSIEASAGGARVSSSLLDPLANRELNQTERQLLEARQRYNIACLEAGGRPEREDALAYAYAVQEAGDHLLAADLFVQLDSSGKSANHATNISYSYSRAARHEQAQKWARIAYERHPDALTAYNMSCRAGRGDKERYLREALRHDPSYECALIGLGELLESQGKSDGRQLLVRATESLKNDLDANRIGAGNCHWLAKAAGLLGNKTLSSRAKARLDTLRGDDSQLFDNENLADSLSSSSLMVNR